MSYTRSATGCFACKTKRKKCDKTRPHCFRCQKSHVECPGYIYTKNSDNPERKPRTLPAVRAKVGHFQVTEASWELSEIEKLGLQWKPHLPPHHSAVISPVLYNVPGTSAPDDAGMLSEPTDMSNYWRSSPPSTDSSTSHWLVINTTDPVSISTPPSLSVGTPLTAGQASLLEALFSLGEPSGLNPPLHYHQSTTDLLPVIAAPLVRRFSVSSTERQDDDDPENTVGIIHDQPVLDRSLESNALPFVLQSYVTWIDRLALEPVHLRHNARDFVFAHFEDGVQSRLIIALLANVGSKIGNVELVEASPNPLVIMLQNAVRQHLGAVVSYPHPNRPTLVRALDSVVETMCIHIFVSPMSEIVILRQEAAPVFRQLCPDLPGAPINLISLLQYPLGCLWHYAGIDITLSLLTDMPTMFRYEVPVPDSHMSPPPKSRPTVWGDDLIQWLNGTPNQVLLLFAEMVLMRSDNFAPNVETVASLEQDIREIRPYGGPSSERFLAVMRYVVQECWKQAAFVYLYMAVCGDTCDTPRVKEALKRVMKLLNGTKTGRLPDEFLIAPLMIVCPAAHRNCDREVLRQRILGLHLRSQKFRGNTSVIGVIENYWARADAQGRPTMWSDIAVSRRQMIGVE